MLRRCASMVVLVAVILPLISGCSYSAYKDYYTDQESYLQIWDLSGFHHGYEGASSFFPATLDELDVVDYYCRYDQQLPLGEGIQVFLEVRYEDDTLFQNEMNRLSTLGFACEEYFEDTNMTAVATRLGEDYASEYALLDGEKRVVRYIYVQNLPEDEIEFDHQFLPNGYTGYGEIS